MNRIARLPLVTAAPPSRLARNLALAAMCAAACLGAGAPGSASASGVDPGWGSVQDVPPYGEAHGLPATGVFPDGTLVAVWANDPEGAAGDITTLLRSTRPPSGTWTEPVVFPVPDVGGVDGIAPSPDGTLQVAYSLWSGAGAAHQVRTWNADGTVEKVALANSSDDYTLYTDAGGDVVAERLGSYDEVDGFDHLLSYFDGHMWQQLPKIGADPRDVFVPGPGDSVWMAGYDQARSKLGVRRWSPGMSAWKLEWSRDYASGHLRKPLVVGLDLAAGGKGRMLLAFQERETAVAGPTLRAVRREGRPGWTRPAILQRLAPDQHHVMTGPVATAAGDHAEVAWTSPARERHQKREVRIANLGSGGPDVRRLAVANAFIGFRSMSLDVDLREDGDVLVTYLQRSGSRRQLVGWFGPHDGIQSTTLLKDAGVMLRDAAFLVPGLAGVVSNIRGQALASRVLEG